MKNMNFREYINQNYKSFCTGCGTCSQKCTHNAISLQEDEQGYYVAHFDSSKCVDCNLCEGVCPSLNGHYCEDRAKEPLLYAIQMKDEIRQLSSSGGFFSAIANIILKDNGIVFGAAWMPDFSVRHIWIDNEVDLSKLRSSKYVQSYIGNSFIECKKFLKSGRKVLFSGTPCQIAGLYAFLGSDYENLITIDVLCFHAPSHKYFQQYLYETSEVKHIYSLNMRDKSQGWCCTNLVIKSKDFHDKEHIDIRTDNDIWEKAFVSHLMMSQHCDNCKYATHQRVGDLTLGDFWEICGIDKSFDNLGTNSVLVNSKKGEKFFVLVKKNALKLAQKNLDDIKGNRINKKHTSSRHKQSRRFENLFVTNGFCKSASICLNDKHDVCVLGCWEVRNFGSHLTYFALFKYLKSLGKSVVFIGCPANAGYKTKGLPEYFKVIPYEEWEMHPQYMDKIEMRDANNLSDTFILGSDQLWFPNLNRYFGDFSYLDFIHSNKRKIAYATSFGTADWNGTDLERRKISYLLSRFSDVSVREKSGINICRDYFDRDAQWNLDPVFLCNVEEYDKLTEKSTIQIKEDYLLAYILDCTNEKADIMMSIGSRLGVKVIIVTDPNISHNLRKDYPILNNIYVEDWIKLIRDSKYVATDSFHGMCVSIVYRKNFVAFRNTKRGSARFDDYGNLFSINDRIIRTSWKVEEIVDCYESCDYSIINDVLAIEVPKSKTWIRNALEKPLIQNTLSDFDMMSILKDEETIDIRKKAEANRIRQRIKTIIKHSLIFKIIKKIR